MHHLAWDCRFNGLITVIRPFHNFSKFPWRGSQASWHCIPGQIMTRLVSLIWLPGGRDSKGVLDGHVHTAINWITSKNLLYSTWNSAQCYVQPEWEGSLGKNRHMCMYGWVPSLFTCKYHNVVNQQYKIIQTQYKIRSFKEKKKDYSESDTSIVKNEIDICHNK